MLHVQLMLLNIFGFRPQPQETIGMASGSKFNRGEDGIDEISRKVDGKLCQSR